MKIRQRQLLFIGFVAFLFLILILPRMNIFNMPFERDEGEYAYSSWILSQNVAPYANSFIQKPPLIIYVYLLAQLISPHGYWSPRLLSLLFSFMTCGLLFILLQHEKRIIASYLCPVFLAAIWTAPFLTASVANVEIFMLLPLVGLYVWHSWHRSFPLKYRDWMLGGFLAATVNLFKPIGAVVTISILLLSLIQNWNVHRDIKKSLLHDISAICAGGSAAILLSAGYFFIQGGWKELIEYSFVYNLFYSPPGPQGRPFFYFQQLFPSMLASWWPLLAVAILSLWVRPYLWKSHLFLLSVIVFSVLFGAYGHYWLLITPFLALIASFTFEQLTKRVIRKEEISPGSAWSLVVIVGVFVAIMLIPVYRYLSLRSEDMVRVFYGTQAPFLEAPKVAEIVASITNDSDRIFVAGSEPEIYFYSKRRSSTPFVITYPMTGSLRFSEHYQKHAIDDLIQYPPKVIVRCRYTDLERAGYSKKLDVYLRYLINREYGLIGGFMKPSETDRGGWKAHPLLPDELDRCSLLVFKRQND
jgi:hypothetical protein